MSIIRMILKVRNYKLIFSGWTVRIYHNLQSDDKESWETFNRHLDIGSHVDICNVTQVLENRNLERNPSAATWRWVKFYYYYK
jgi:hypothetical protein